MLLALLYFSLFSPLLGDGTHYLVYSKVIIVINIPIGEYLVKRRIGQITKMMMTTSFSFYSDRCIMPLFTI